MAGQNPTMTKWVDRVRKGTKVKNSSGVDSRLATSSAQGPSCRVRRDASAHGKGLVRSCEDSQSQ